MGRKRGGKVARSVSRLAPLHRPVTLSVVMPVFNEVMTVAEAIDRVIDLEDPDFSIELIIVESNSTDGTREIVDKYRAEPNVRIIRQDQPRGKGHAVRTGLGEVTGQIVLIQDGDLEYEVGDYPKLVEPILAGEADFVLGSRHSRGEPIRIMPNEPLASLVTNAAHWVLLTLFNLTYQVRLHDPFTMYKVFRTECLQGAHLVANRFDFDWEFVGKMIRLGYSPWEIPVCYTARGFRAGKKIRFLRDPITWIIACIRFRFGKLRVSQ